MSTSESNKDDLPADGHADIDATPVVASDAFPDRMAASITNTGPRRNTSPPPIPNNARGLPRARTTSQNVRARATLPPPTGRAVPPPIPSSAMRVAAPDGLIDIPIDVEAPVPLRPRGQGTVPPTPSAVMPPPFIITPGLQSRGDIGLRSPSFMAVTPLRFEQATESPPPADNQELFADGWFQAADRTSEVRDMFESGWTRDTPLESERSSTALWLFRVVVVVCVAGLAFMVARRESSPSATTAPTGTAERVQRLPSSPTASTHAADGPTQAAQEMLATEHAVTVSAQAASAPSTGDADPSSTTKVLPPPAVAETTTTPSATKHAKTSRAPTSRRPPQQRKEHPNVAASASREGTLMVSTKPPCEIVIDGVATVLTTPQRAMKLRAGKHALTLFNLRLGIEITLPITIEARKTTKVIRDLMPLQQSTR